MNRWLDWWEQAEHDLEHARHALEGAHFDWSAFAAQQAAEKALKALILRFGGEPWGHSTAKLIESLPESASAPEPTSEAARRLDKHYVPSRYPNGLPSGSPADSYTRGEAQKAIEDAETILGFVRSRLSRP